MSAMPDNQRARILELVQAGHAYSDVAHQVSRQFRTTLTRAGVSGVVYRHRQSQASSDMSGETAAKESHSGYEFTAKEDALIIAMVRAAQPTRQIATALRADLGVTRTVGRIDGRVQTLRRRGVSLPNRANGAVPAVSLSGSSKLQPCVSAVAPSVPTLTVPGLAGPSSADCASEGTTVALTGRQPHHCRWPVSGAGADMRFCSAAAAEPADRPIFCAAHARRGFEKHVRAQQRAQSGDLSGARRRGPEAAG